MYGPYQSGTARPYIGARAEKWLSLVRPVPSLVRAVPDSQKCRFFASFAPNLQKTNKPSAVPNSKDISMKSTQL